MVQRNGWAIVATVVAITLGILYVMRGSQIDSLERQLDAKTEELRTVKESFDGSTAVIETCRQAVRDAQRFAKGAIHSHESLYDEAHAWVADAYVLGTRGISSS